MASERNSDDQCARCKSFWGKMWALCQRCGFHLTLREQGELVREQR